MDRKKISKNSQIFFLYIWFFQCVAKKKKRRMIKVLYD